MLTGVLAFIVFLWILRGLNVVLTWALVPRLAPAPRRGEEAPFVSIIVPARNEERDVGQATASRLALDDPRFEVVVVNDGSKDRTREIVEDLAASSAGRLRLIAAKEPPQDWLGKPHALFVGAEAADAKEPGDWLLFSDADVTFAPDLLARAFAEVERRNLDFLTLFPELEARTAVERLIIPTIGDIFFAYAPGWLATRDRPRWLGLGAGVFNLIRRDAYDAVGGHAALKASIADDVQLGRLAKRSGARCGIAMALESVRVRMYHGPAETMRGFTKNCYFGLGGRLFTAVPILLLFGFEGLLPWIVLTRGLLGGGAPPGSLVFGLGAGAVALTLLVRGALHRLLGYPPLLVILHPVWVLAVTSILAWSTWVNGVLGRNVWRGRVRDARGLRL